MRSNLFNCSAATISMLVVIMFITVPALAQESSADSSKTAAAAESQRSDQASKAAGNTESKTEAKKEDAKAEEGDLTASNSLAGLSTRPFAGQPKTNVFVSEESPKAPKQAATSSGWQVAFAPYLYMTGISGTVGARGRVIEVDASFGDVLSNLSFGLMGVLQARRGRLVINNDIVWTKMDVERTTPGPLFNTARVDTNLFIFNPEVGYRLFEGKGGSFDILGGMRLWSVENTLQTTTGILPGFSVSDRKTWAAFVGGFHGVANLSPRFFLSTKFDIGAGSGTDITTQFYGGAGFRITPKAALIGGYRYMKVDYEDGNGFVFNTYMSGFVLGARFQF